MKSKQTWIPKFGVEVKENDFKVECECSFLNLWNHNLTKSSWMLQKKIINGLLVSYFYAILIMHSIILCHEIM